MVMDLLSRDNMLGSAAAETQPKTCDWWSRELGSGQVSEQNVRTLPDLMDLRLRLFDSLLSACPL
jgi:hypothetical protein